MSERCDIPEHGPSCEGPHLHIRARDANGCAQFQDGSWITKDRGACRLDHPRGSAPDYGQGERYRDWLETSFGLPSITPPTQPKATT